jgi:cytoskeletal protein CcmA (bactofilin family)
MWKRSDEESAVPEHRPLAAPAAAAAPSSSPRTSRGAALGRSLHFEGRLTGDEDLLVEGRFAGEISIPGHQVTIGPEGRVEAEVKATAIVVEGEVHGNLTADQQVVVRASGKVHGDIRAPRVALDQGCRFKGTIDMEPGRKDAAAREAMAKGTPPEVPPEPRSPEESAPPTEGKGSILAQGSANAGGGKASTPAAGGPPRANAINS